MTPAAATTSSDAAHDAFLALVAKVVAEAASLEPTAPPF